MYALRLCPASWDRERARHGEGSENGLQLRLSHFPRGQLSRTSFCNLEQKAGIITLRLIVGMGKWGIERQNAQNSGRLLAVPSLAPLMKKGPELRPQGFGVKHCFSEEIGH